MIRYSLIATLVAFITTLISMVVFKSFDATSSIACSGITALIMIQVWGRSRKPLPTPSEKNTFLLIYWILMSVIFLMPTLVISSNPWGVANVLILAGAYPLFMLILFREKFLLKHVQN